MSAVKTLIEQISEIKPACTLGRVKMVGVFSVYGEAFNRERAENYFVNIPECVQWRDSDKREGRYTFFIEGVGAYFRPATISAFIDIMDSLGEKLEVNSTEHVIEKTKWFL